VDDSLGVINMVGIELSDGHVQTTALASHKSGERMRVLIADDHDLVRETIAAFLIAEGQIEVECAGSLDEAVAITSSWGPFDLVLLDYHMPGMAGLDGLSTMRQANQDKPVALISGTAKPDIAEAAIRAGAAGFVPKTMASKSMVAAIRFMAEGEVFVPYAFIRQGVDQKDAFGLTQRERNVLGGLALGKSNKEIARDLDLQEVTVKLHVKTLSRKLGARNRTHAVMIARDAGLV
jgi:DNA-binding NarL/FixJ family response regulator